MDTTTRDHLAIGGVPLHAIFAPIPIVCFIGALITDIAYAKTALIQWSNFSAWLLAIGIIFGAIDALLGLIDWFRARPRPAGGLWHFLGYSLVLLLALINNFVHARDGWTSVVPTGLALSIVTVVILVVMGLLGRRAMHSQAREART